LPGADAGQLARRDAAARRETDQPSPPDIIGTQVVTVAEQAELLPAAQFVRPLADQDGLTVTRRRAARKPCTR
jgi:hypothetical protein